MGGFDKKALVTDVLDEVLVGSTLYDIVYEGGNRHPLVGSVGHVLKCALWDFSLGVL